MALGKLSKDYPQLDLTRARFLDLARVGKMKSAHDSAVTLLQRMCAVHVGMHLPMPTPVHFTVDSAGVDRLCRRHCFVFEALDGCPDPTVATPPGGRGRDRRL